MLGPLLRPEILWSTLSPLSRSPADRLPLKAPAALTRPRAKRSLSRMAFPRSVAAAVPVVAAAPSPRAAAAALMEAFFRHTLLKDNEFQSGNIMCRVHLKDHEFEFQCLVVVFRRQRNGKRVD